MELHFIKWSSPLCKEARCWFRPVYTTDFVLGWCRHLCRLNPYVITPIKSAFPPRIHFVHVYGFSNKTASVFTGEKGAQGASCSLQQDLQGESRTTLLPPMQLVQKERQAGFLILNKLKQFLCEHNKQNYLFLKERDLYNQLHNLWIQHFRSIEVKPFTNPSLIFQGGHLLTFFYQT